MCQANALRMLSYGTVFFDVDEIRVIAYVQRRFLSSREHKDEKEEVVVKNFIAQCWLRFAQSPYQPVFRLTLKRRARKSWFNWPGSLAGCMQGFRRLHGRGPDGLSDQAHVRSNKDQSAQGCVH